MWAAKGSWKTRNGMDWTVHAGFYCWGSPYNKTNVKRHTKNLHFAYKAIPIRQNINKSLASIRIFKIQRTLKVDATLQL